MTVYKSGQSYPPKKTNCKLVYEYGDFGKAFSAINSGKYVQVGSISVKKMGPALSQELKDLVQPKSCELGGTLVLLSGQTDASLLVLRKIQ